MRTKTNQKTNSITYVGIDNGVSGSVGIVTSWGTYSFMKVPVFKAQNYTKKKGNVSRVNVKHLMSELKVLGGIHVLIERPMINGTRFKASLSAARALEAVLIVLELLDNVLRYDYIDSKEWQREFLSMKGDTKKESRDVGLRLFRNQAALIEKQKDADGLLIAEYARRIQF